jgi:hypothetical protein
MVVDERYADDIARGAKRHGYLYERSLESGNRLTLQFPYLPEEELLLLPVAWLGSVLEEAGRRGVQLILRPGGSEFQGEDGIQGTLEFCRNQQLVLFEGPTVLGYPDRLRAVAEILEEQNQAFGWIEFDEQDGGASLAARLAPQVVRVHSIPPEEMVNYDPVGAVARYLRAVKERSIRCIYVRPFVRATSAGLAAVAAEAGDSSAGGYRQQLHAVNKEYFSLLAQRITDAGFSISADVPVPLDPLAWLDFLRPLFTTLAAGAAGIILFAWWFPGWPLWVWSLFLLLTGLKGLLALFNETFDLAVLLATALFFPLLGFWLAFSLYQRWAQRLPTLSPYRLLCALCGLLIASVAAAAGGLLIHGGMWDAAAILKTSQFRGVTLALAVPLLMLAAYAWQAESLQDAYDRAIHRVQDYWQRFTMLWQSPIRYGDVAFILIALGALAVVLLRSGNESPLGVLSVESWFRGSLEQWFDIRPRTKELIGHPLLVVFFLSLPWRNRISLLFALAGLLGQVSILNTFCHLHTSLLVTVERVTLGLGLGLVSGLVWGLLILLVGWAWVGLRNRPRGNLTRGD